jgi:hypothetical protein
MEVPVAIAAGRRNDAASTEPFGASRETRANGVEAATKKQKETLLFRLSSDAILATLVSTRNERVPPAISL